MTQVPTDIAQRGIAGRGILLDYRDYALRKGIQYSPFETYAITLEDLKVIAKEEKVTFKTGDILLIRTGWTEEYNKLREGEKYALSQRAIRASCGVDASEAMLKWHWENQFSAIASDTVAYEVWPSPRQLGVSAHEVCFIIFASFGIDARCQDIDLLTIPL
jgi:kynurenine formamidase